ncbi:MAG: hypothetical protein AB7V46_20685, partial [Thermomicrobiales bacterium]
MADVKNDWLNQTSTTYTMTDLKPGKYYSAIVTWTGPGADELELWSNLRKSGCGLHPEGTSIIETPGGAGGSIEGPSNPTILFSGRDVDAGESISVWAAADDATYNTVRVTTGCGTPDRFEIGAPKAQFDWSTAGCPGGMRTVTAEARLPNDPNWTNAIRSSAQIYIWPSNPGSDGGCSNGDWATGQQVPLKQGAEFRTGPGPQYPLSGTASYDGWRVNLINPNNNSPTCVGEDDWWNTDSSPEGSTQGTGWVNRKQALAGAPPAAPSLSLTANPSSGNVGVRIAIEASSSDPNYNTVRVTTGCGTPDRFETGAPSVSFTWDTWGCPGGSRNVLAEARTASDTSWTNPIAKSI